MSLPAAQRLYERYRNDARVRIVAVATAWRKQELPEIADEEKIRGVLREHGWTFPVMRDRDEKTVFRFAVGPAYGVPMTVVVDPDGIVRWHGFNMSAETTAAVERRVEELLAAQAARPRARKAAAGNAGKPPRAKSVVRAGDWTDVTLVSGASARLYVPAGVAPDGQPGLVVALHGAGVAPEEMLEYGRGLADRRGEIWCAPLGTAPARKGRSWDPGKDETRVAEIARWAAAEYRVPADRILLFGYSAGGAVALAFAARRPEFYRGVVVAAATDVPRTPKSGAAPRTVFLLGDGDPNHAALAPRATEAVKRLAPEVSFWTVTGLGHEPPAPAWLDAAFREVLDPSARGGVKTVPREPPAE